MGLKVWPLPRLAEFHPSGTKGPPDENTPKKYASTAEEDLIKETLVEAKSSPLKLPEKILESASKSRVSEKILENFLLRVGKTLACSPLLRSSPQPFIILFTLYRICQNPVSFSDLLESLFCTCIVRIMIRVVLKSKSAIPLPNLLFGSVLVDLENF
jgi:hypothetical protein